MLMLRAFLTIEENFDLLLHNIHTAILFHRHSFIYNFQPKVIRFRERILAVMTRLLLLCVVLHVSESF